MKTMEHHLVIRKYSQYLIPYWIICFLLLSFSAFAQPLQPAHIFSQTSLTYTETFNSMGLTQLYPQGWDGFRVGGTGIRGAQLIPIVSDGNSNSGGVYNVGADPTERALGTLSSGSTAPAIGACFLNSTGSLITSFSLGLFVEQWRTGSNSNSVEICEFEYSINALGINDTNATWVPISSLNLIEIVQNSTSSQAINGNLTQFRQPISGSILNIFWANNQFLFIRWKDVDNLGSDAMFAIDDLTLTVVQTSAIVSFNVDVTNSAAHNSNVYLKKTQGIQMPVLKLMTNVSPNIWSISDTIPGGTILAYSYTTGTNPTDVESLIGSCPVNGQRRLVAIDTVLPIVCFGFCLPEINFTGLTEFCQNDSIILSTQIGTGNIYQWKVNGVIIPGAVLPSYVAKTTGNYSVTVTNSNNCSSTSYPINVRVFSFPTSLINFLGDTTICSGDSIILNANLDSNITYQWKRDGNDITGATSSSYLVTISGDYSVLVTSFGNCSTLSQVIRIVVNPIPSATISAAAPTTFCQGDSVVLNANTGTGLSFQWRLNGTNISGATASSYTATQNGDYTVLVTNATNCSSLSQVTTVIVNPLPAASISASTPTVFCQGISVTLFTNTGLGLSYQWQLNGTTITGATASNYTATQSGNYTVLVTNTTNCSSLSQVTTVIVNPLPAASIMASGPTSFCQGDSITLNASTGTGLSYQWKLNGNNITGANSSNYIATQSGNYIVQVTDSNNCSRLSQPTTITVNLPPTAIIASSTPILFCQGDSVTLIANGGGVGLTYQWKLNGNNISGATSSNFIATLSGAYTVQVTNANNCTKLSQPTTVTVNPLPAANISVTAPTTFCQGDSVVLNANTGTGLTYQWRLDGSNISGATASSFRATQSGNYTVLVTNATNCSSLAQATTVTVNPLPASIISASTPTAFCQGGSVTLNANIDTGLLYQWQLNGTAISGATASNYSATQGGNYTVVVTNSNGCLKQSAAQNVIVQPSFTGGPIIGQTNNIIPNQPYIYAVSQNPNRSYVWNITNGALLAGQGTNTITVLWGNLLQGQVRLIETFELCSDTLELNVGIGQGTSVPETSRNVIQLYPNPNQGLFYLKSPTSLGAIRVTNALGQVVWNGQIEENEFEVNLSHLADGLYQVVVNNQVLRVMIRK